MRSQFVAVFIITSMGWISPSFATVEIDWFSAMGNEVLQADTSLAPSGWTAQLIYTTSATGRDPVDPENPFAGGPNETVLETQALNTLNIPGLLVGGATGRVSIADTFSGGYVYTRVFNATFGTAEVPTLFGLSTNQSGPLTITAGMNLPNKHEATGLIVNQALMAIPEPSTYALLGFGAVVAFLRHRKLHAKS